MAYRILDSRIVKIDIVNNKLIIKAQKPQIKNLKTTFKVNSKAVITGKNNRSLSLLDLRVGNRVIIDFIKLKGENLVKGITVLG